MSIGGGNIFLGTSGWSYKEWIGPFYSKEDKSMLRAYTQVFKTVEIDSTFYRYPSKGAVMGWTRYSPEGFIYAAKLPKLITHEKRLSPHEGVEEDVQRFLELMEPLSLSGKLACILIQLAPKYRYQPQQLESFFALLPTHVRFAVEFRHPSWMNHETWTLLEKYKVAYTIVDEPLLPPEIHVTTDFAYIRWHGHGTRPWYDYQYSSNELEQWVPKVQETAAKAEKTYGYFNNHFRGNAVKNVLEMLEKLGIQTPQQKIARNKVEKYFNALAKTKEPKLEVFAEPKEVSFEELIRYFVAAGRLERAQNTKDTELTITEETEQRVNATIKEYHISIDMQNKTIQHDCADWEKIAATHKLCKHIAKLFLTLDRTVATEILRRLYQEKDSWRFKTPQDS